MRWPTWAMLGVILQMRVDWGRDTLLPAPPPAGTPCGAAGLCCDGRLGAPLESRWWWVLSLS